MHSSRSGLIAGLAAFVAWGLVPLYWRQIRHVPAFEILAHRAIWSVVLVGLFIAARRQWRDLVQTPRALAITALRGALVSANWLIFIWAVNAGHIVETSMGYFITPLINVVFGLLVFHEKMVPLQWLAVALAAVGVLAATAGTHHGFPWIALGIALTFASYGALKKVASIAPLPSLFLETAFMTPLALGFLWLKPDRVSVLPLLAHDSLFLIGGGLITVFPLLWFAQATQQLRFSTIGFLQFLAPSLSFLVGVLIYQEDFPLTRLIAFGFIWAGVLVFSISAWLRSRETTQPPLRPVTLE